MNRPQKPIAGGERFGLILTPIFRCPQPHRKRGRFWAITMSVFQKVDPEKTNPVNAVGAGYHPHGLEFFDVCDGSVHFLDTSIDMELFANLATIDGKDMAVLPE